MRTRTLAVLPACLILAASLPALLVAQSPVPVISSVTPVPITQGNPGVVLTITGSGFCGTTDSSGDLVSFQAPGAIYPSSLSTTEVSATELTAYLTSETNTTAGTASLTVMNCYENTSTPFSVTVVPQPTVSTFSPPGAAVGGPGFNLTITGTNFVSGMKVSWCLNGCGEDPTILTPSSITATQIGVAIPASLYGTMGSATVAVVMPDGFSVSASSPFSVYGAPIITSLQPSGASAGSPAFLLTIPGINFVTNDAVLWNGTALSGASYNPNLRELTVTVPANLITTPGAMNVTVQDPGGVVSTPALFTVVGPSISSLSPASAVAGAPGFNLTITGANFVTGSGVTWTPPSSSPVSLTVVSQTATQIVATVPSSLLTTAGAATVKVTNPGGASTTALFSVGGPAITNLSPASANTGSAGFNLTVTGTNFLSGSVVRWGNTTLSTVGPPTATQITASVTSALLATAGPVSVTVQNPGGAISNALAFTVSGPALTSLSPSSRAAGSAAFNLTVTGSGFVSGSTIRWNSTALPTVGAPTSTQIVGSVAASLISTAGSVSITVQNPGGATSNALTFTVGTPPVSITTTGISPATVGVPYSVTFTGSGGVPPYTWSASGLPSGFTLNSGTGQLSGTSNSPSSSTITIQVTDSQEQTVSKSFSFRVTAPALSVQTETLPHGTVGVAYSQTVSAVGGTSPYTWSVNQGTLPPGLTLQAASGLISGTPSSAGTYPVGLLVTDGSGAVSGRLFTLVIDTTGLAVATLNLPDGVAGIAYTSPPLEATGGKAPYTWALGAGTSAGFTVGSSSGVITGTAQSPGAVTLVVQVTDSNGSNASKTFTVNFGSGFTITTAALDGASIGVAYPIVQFNAAGGTPPYTWSLSQGSLPAGMSLDAGGVLSGTPTTQGQSSFTVHVQDSKGQTANKQFQIVVATPVEIGTQSLSDGTLGKSYSIVLSASGGAGPYMWSVSSGLPGGVTLNSNGTLSGAPTHAGTFTFTVTATDSVGRKASKELTLKIATTLAITTTAIPAGTGGSPFNTSIQVAGGTPPYSFSASGLPGGLSLDPASGQISGKPTAAGDITVVVTVTDGDQQSVASTFTFKIALPSFSGVNIVGVPSTSDPAQQPPVSITINSPYPLDITGTLTLTFASTVGGDDQMVQFSTGGRTVTYTIPANSTNGVFPVPQGVSILTGTVAGTITITTTLKAGGQDITPSPAPTQTIVIAKSAPVITSLKVTRTASGFTAVIAGYSTPRDMTQATFQFTAAAGATLQSSSVTVALTSAFSAWYGSADSNQFGSQFTLTLPFTIQGGATTVAGLSVTLTNSVGTSSPPASANF